MEKIGWEPQKNDGHLTTLLRGIMVHMLSQFAYDDPSVVAEATSRFRAFQQDHNDVQSLPSDMRSEVFQIFLKNGGPKEYEEVKSYFYSATDNAERKHVLNSLGSIPDPKLKLATMEWTTSGEVKLQDFFYAMGSVGRSSKEGREISWKYFQDNFDKIKGMLEKASPSLMGACIIMCAGAFCSNEKADEIEAFFKAHPLPSNELKISQTVEGMRANAKLLKLLKSSELSKPDFWKAL
jgi:puromycin-sensitive aminopeptidase